MLLFPNAKINLGLYVVEKRADGFHNLETVFVPVPWRDALEVVPARQADATLTVSGIAVNVDPEKNLVMKAYRLMQQRHQLPPVDIYLHKVIPFGAGLGGGSADAAFMVKLLNQHFALGLDEEQLAEYAAELGSDCPFFVYNRPMMATGRGELLTPFDLDLSGYTVVLAKPHFGISTPEAFSGITPKQPAQPLAEALAQPIECWKDGVFNDFEQHLFVKYPELEEIKRAMYSNGAAYAAMSGSGSTIFGLFRNDIGLSFPGCTTFSATL